MIARPAAASENLLDELQATLSHGTVARRVETLRRVTDLFINGATTYSDEQISLFDDVLQCLIQHIEAAARIVLAERLAPVETAPRGTIRSLALDDLIDVARPVLSKSERLDDPTLVEIASNKSQAHLEAISIRRVLSEAVTDVLVIRGNDEVVRSAVNNAGARFSEAGFAKLVDRAEGNDGLATCLGMRRTLPRHLYLKLVAKASETVRGKLQAAHPRLAEETSAAVQEATRRACLAASPPTEQTVIAHGLVKSLFEDGRLDEQQVASFAEQGKFDETIAALAALAKVPVPDAENMMTEIRTEGVMILAKVAGLSWLTVRAILDMRDRLSGGEAGDATSSRETYERLRSSTAQQVLRFHRMQQQAGASVPAA